MPVATSLAPAGRWLLDSGIQEPSGGFARFYDAETGKNRPISTEISGYAASALIWLFDITGDEVYLARARKTAAFLAGTWNKELGTFPFEHPSPSPESDHLSYFFDCGIIIRGLLAVWHQTRDEELLAIAWAAARGMIADFHAGQDFHPILSLPAKEPLPRTTHWSRGPGCYQLKSAMAWWDVGRITGENALTDAYLEMLSSALATHAEFLPQSACEHTVMDRLHPYCYFLEGLLPELARPECINAYVQTMASISLCLRKIAPVFVRADVYAQLLRARVYGARFVPVDAPAAAEEAEALTQFQAAGNDLRIDGGFYFGKRSGKMSPHVNPVSTVFAIQALEVWERWSAGNEPPCLRMLV